jgi:large subunit ribosomal protein L35
MPKNKTHKGTAKRLRKTKSGKILHRTSGQDHFNSRETGKVKKNKRRDSSLHATSKKLRSLIIHAK